MGYNTAEVTVKLGREGWKSTKSRDSVESGQCYFASAGQPRSLLEWREEAPVL